MTAHTKGWVEVPHPFTRCAPGTPEWIAQGARWEGILNLEPLLAWHAFTDTEWAVLDGALAAGFPEGVSKRVQAEYSQQQADADIFDAGALTQPRWTSLAKLRAILPRLKDLRLPKSTMTDWRTLMHMLDVLAARYGDEQVRLILWSSVVM